MKKLALAAAAIAAFTGQALAADMPVKAIRPAPVVAAVNWTGCYVGGGGGYGMFHQRYGGGLLQTLLTQNGRYQATATFTNGDAAGPA